MNDMKIRCGHCGHEAHWSKFDPDQQTVLPEHRDPSGNPVHFNPGNHTWVCPKCDAACTPPSQKSWGRYKTGKEALRA
jgi:hypothetical protein